MNTHLAYDGAGNTKTVTPPVGPTTTYSWDWRNKLISVDQGETNIAQFQYDGDGNRTDATFGSETTSFLYDGGQVIAELDGQGALKAFYVLGADGVISRLAAVPAYYHGDGLWSVKAMSDGSSNVTDAYAYDAWGNGLAHFGSAQQPYQYVGRLGYYAHYQDPAFGLLQLGARYYEPGIGRFISRDPAKDGMNWYAYVSDRPVDLVDPVGLSAMRPSKNDLCRKLAMELYIDCLKLRVGYGAVGDIVICTAVCGAAGITAGVFTLGGGGPPVFVGCMRYCLGVGMPCVLVLGFGTCTIELFNYLKWCDENFPH